MYNRHDDNIFTNKSRGHSKVSDTILYIIDIFFLCVLFE